MRIPFAILVSLVLFLLRSDAVAQGSRDSTDYERIADSFPVGPIFTMGVSKASTDKAGWKSTLELAYQVGAIGSIRIADDWDAMLGLVYDSRSTYFYQTD